MYKYIAKMQPIQLVYFNYSRQGSIKVNNLVYIHYRGDRGEGIGGSVKGRREVYLVCWL